MEKVSFVGVSSGLFFDGLGTGTGAGVEKTGTAEQLTYFLVGGGWSSSI